MYQVALWLYYKNTLILFWMSTNVANTDKMLRMQHCCIRFDYLRASLMMVIFIYTSWESSSKRH